MMNSKWIATLWCAVLTCFARGSSAAEPSLNILWFVVDDMSPCFSCYGERLIETPHVDRLALEGTRFSRAYVTAPVCSPCRSALITGMYQTSIGAHQHRSGRGELKIHLPDGVKPIPEWFHRAGYFTCIGSGLPGKDHERGDAEDRAKKNRSVDRLGKTDYNFEWDASLYDGDDWAGRRPDQPFFMQVQLHGGKLREGATSKRADFRKRVIEELGSATDPEKVILPPYYPRDPLLLEDWALFLDAVRMTDNHVGKVISRLEQEKLLDQTLVIFMTDHGISHARGKQFLYDEGTRIPLVARGPAIPRNVVRHDLVQHIDLAATSLAAAGISLPATIQGRDLFAKDFTPHEAVFAARDRCDETIDRIRSVRTDRFLYIRNFYPNRPHLQPNAYKDGKAIVQRLRELHANGQLDALQEGLLFRPTRPSEELYEYAVDRWQVNNLADDEGFRATLEAHRRLLDRWIIESGDRGPESEAMYDSDMAEYLRKPNPEVEANIATMKRWSREGK